MQIFELERNDIMNPKFNLNNIGNIEGSNALKPNVENVVSPKINELEDNRSRNSSR